MKIVYIAIWLLLHTLFIKAQNRQQYEPIDLYNAVEDESELKPGENIDDKIKKNFFLRAEVSKDKCFVGEPIMAVFKAYSRLDANSQVVKRPSLSGFSVMEMVDAYSNRPDVEKLNGKYFYVHLIRKVQLFPLQAGDFSLEPAEVESVIQFSRSTEPKGRIIRLRDLFRRSRKDPDLQRQITFKSPEVNIHVNPLPEKEQPEDFSGAVGKFTIEMSMSDTSVHQNEPAVVKLLVKGTGNFPLITDPSIDWPKGVQVSGPSVSENVNKYVYPLSGVKTFQYTLDHRHTGTYIVPSVKFSYFDPSSKSYKVAESSAITYTVAKGRRGKKISPKDIILQPNETPLQYYYFGVIVLIIFGLIIYQLVKAPNK